MYRWWCDREVIEHHGLFKVFSFTHPIRGSVHNFKALSHYNVLVQRPNCVCEKLFPEQNIGERFKKLRKSSHPLTWLRPGGVFPPFTASLYHSCTAQSTFLLRPTTFSCHSATVLDDLQPPVLRPCTVLCVLLSSSVWGVLFRDVGWAHVSKWWVAQRNLIFIPPHRTLQDLWERWVNANERRQSPATTVRGLYEDAWGALEARLRPFPDDL